MYAHLNSPQLNPIVIIFLTKPCFHMIDYAMKENEILYDLDAVTICMFANWNPMNFSPEGDQCMFSYAVPGSHNELTLFTYLNLRILIHGNRRFYLVLISFIIAEELHNNQIISFIFKTPSPWLLKKFRGKSFCKFLCLCM